MAEGDAEMPGPPPDAEATGSALLSACMGDALIGGGMCCPSAGKGEPLTCREGAGMDRWLMAEASEEIRADLWRDSASAVFGTSDEQRKGEHRVCWLHLSVHCSSCIV